MTNLNELRDAIHKDAVAHGLWNGENAHYAALKIQYEMWELMRESDGPVTDAFAEELADVIIMSLSVAGHLGIDIAAAVARKMEINKRRPYRHEGERKEATHG